MNILKKDSQTPIQKVFAGFREMLNTLSTSMKELNTARSEKITEIKNTQVEVQTIDAQRILTDKMLKALDNIAELESNPTKSVPFTMSDPLEQKDS